MVTNFPSCALTVLWSSVELGDLLLGSSKTFVRESSSNTVSLCLCVSCVSCVCVSINLCVSVSVSGHGHGHGHVYVYVFVCVCVYVYVYVKENVECVWKDGERTVSRAKSGETLVEASCVCVCVFCRCWCAASCFQR